MFRMLLALYIKNNNPNVTVLDDFQPIIEVIVAKITLHLNNSKSCHWDEIPVILLKLSVQVFSQFKLCF